MGMFDRVRAVCPNCSENVEFQSKAGDCTLETFDVWAVPMAIAAALNGQHTTCQACGASVTIRSMAVEHVEMRVE